MQHNVVRLLYAGAWLYEYRMELQLWASCRGQLLARTVTGMMRNEKALRVLVKLEHPKPPDMSELEYHQWMDNMVRANAMRYRPACLPACLPRHPLSIYMPVYTSTYMFDYLAKFFAAVYGLSTQCT